MGSMGRGTKILLACFTAAACGDDAKNESAATATGSGTTALSGTATVGSASGTATASTSGSGSDSQTGGATASGSGTTTGGIKFDVGAGGDLGGPACRQCSADMHDVLDCMGNVVETCPAGQACDSTTWGCSPACQAAANNASSVGCEYFATKMDHSSIYDAQGVCFAAYVANTWDEPVQIEVEFDGQLLPVADFTRIPVGTGPGLTLAPYDDQAGLAPGEVAVLFLSGPTGNFQYGKVPCPVAPAVAGEVVVFGTGIGKSFRISTDRPVVAYQINPYGAGVGAAVAGASLLIPTSAWDGNYVAADAYKPDLAGEWPSLNIVAREDGTTVTLNPVVAVQGGGGLPSGPAGQPLQFTLDAGEHAQFTQQQELTGSIVLADKPVGLMAGHNGLRVPVGVAYADHAEQMIPPVRALGHEYVGVMHKPRGNEPAVWRLVGAVDGTQLTYEPDVGGPATLDRGEVAEFVTGTPFVVRSQDEDHPFMLHTYMSGSTWNLIGKSGYGDADFVISVPPDQYLESYVFYTDPSYPSTNLVVVRVPENGAFADVDLDCYGALDGWQPVGPYEWTRVDLMTGNYEPVGGCATGVHTISSAAPFGLWVWGWGSPETSEFTENRSYGYPGGMNIRPINDVVIDPAG